MTSFVGVFRRVSFVAPTAVFSGADFAERPLAVVVPYAVLLLQSQRQPGKPIRSGATIGLQPSGRPPAAKVVAELANVLPVAELAPACPRSEDLGYAVVRQSVSHW